MCICVCACPLIYVSRMHLSIYLSTYLSIYLSTYLSIYLSVCLSICLYVCLLCVYIYMYVHHLSPSEIQEWWARFSACWSSTFAKLEEVKLGLFAKAMALTLHGSWSNFAATCAQSWGGHVGHDFSKCSGNCLGQTPGMLPRHPRSSTQTACGTTAAEFRAVSGFPRQG